MVFAVIVNFVVVPVIAYGAADLLISDDHPGLKTGLILNGSAAGAPFLPSSSRPLEAPWQSGSA